jgi:ribonuclease-3
MKHIVKPGLHGLETGFGTFPAQNDPKSELQERTQATSSPPPAYQVIKMSGPDHQPNYEVEVRLRRRNEAEPYITARGNGASKKQAEQNAAAEALDRMTQAAKA